MEINEVIIDRIKCIGLDATTKYMVKQCSDNDLTYKAALSSLTRLHQKYQHLNKSKSRVKGKENLERFMKDKYKVPVAEFSISKCTPTVLAGASPFLPCDDVHLKASTYQNVAVKLAGELIATQDSMESVIEERDSVIKEKDLLNVSLEKNITLVETQKKALKRTANRENYYRQKTQKLEHGGIEDDNQILYERIEELELKLSAKNEEIRDLKQAIDAITIENIEMKQVENLMFFDESTNCYNPKLHACVYTMLDNHVSSEHVSKVIESVLHLCNKTANKLPCASTINNWSIERALIARRHISSTCNDANTILHTDEASKYGSKWGVFATRNEEGQYVLLGLRDMATKSSSDTLDTFKNILSDIDAAGSTETDVSKKIITNIKNTMSDRASTETKFNNMLQTYRDTILPDVIANYNEMNEQSRQAISQMNNFFCGLHTLVHMADVSQKSIYEAEKAHFEGEIPIDNPLFAKTGQSATVRLIPTACKAFARRGDQKNGCHQSFKVYIDPFLKENNMLALPLQPLKGNRFNILFTNAGHVYFLKDQMLQFLEKSSSTNGLLRSVLSDLKVPFLLPVVRLLVLFQNLLQLLCGESLNLRTYLSL